MRFIDGEEKKDLAKIRKDGIRRVFFPLIKNSQNVYPYFSCGNTRKVLQ